MRLRILLEPHHGASYAQILALATAAEEGGFDAFFRSDHYLGIDPDDTGYQPTDSWTTLAGLAVQTRRVRLGTLVNASTFRLPGQLAVEVATVDQMSGGRAELGIGAAWYEREHNYFGIPFPPLGERFDRLEEQLEIVTGLWDTPLGQPYEFHGSHYELAPGPALPKPAQRPHPPVIIGGVGRRRTPALAARFAAEFNVPFADVETARARIEGVRAACREAGRDPDQLVYSHAITVCCAEDEAELARRADRIGRSVEELRAGGAAGAPEQVAARLREYADAGASRCYLQVIDFDDLDHVALIASEVMPRVA